MRGFDYAALYPENVGSMVLDGAVDHSLSTTAAFASQVHSFSLVMRRMLQWMSDNSTSSLHGRDTIKIWRDLVERADADPLAAPDCVQSQACFPSVNGADLRIAMVNALGHPNVLWSQLAENLLQAYDNDNASGFSYPILESETGTTSSQLAIICHDWEFRDDWEEWKLLSYMSSAFSLDPAGATGGRLWAIGCARWPAKVTNPPRSLRVRNSNSAVPIMIVHALLDNVVGYDQAIGLHQRIDNSFLLTRYGEGHGSLEWTEGVLTIFDYFIRGSLPEPGALVDQPWSQEVVTDFEVIGWNQMDNP